MLEKTGEYPSHLLNYPINLIFNRYTSSTIMLDEYVYGTYFSMLFQGISDRGEPFKNMFEKITPGFIGNYINDLNNSSKSQESLMKIVNQLRSQFNEELTTTYVKDFLLATSFYRFINQNYSADDCLEKTRELILHIRTHIETFNLQIVSSITLNLDRIKKLIKLSNEERALIEVNFLFSTDSRAAIFINFLFSLLKNPSATNDIYRAMMGDSLESSIKSSKSFDSAFSEESRPIVLGIVDYNFSSHRLGRMSEFWCFMIANYAENDKIFFSRFVGEVKESTDLNSFSGAIAKISNPQDEELIKTFIDIITFRRAHKADLLSDNLNMLFYGSQKLDKIGYIAELLSSCGVTGYRAIIKKASSRDIPSICYIAQQRMSSIDKYGVLIIEKAEQALSKSRNTPSWFTDMFGDSDKPDDVLDSDELLLVKNPIPTIWLTNSASSITQENIGKFLLHNELKGGSRKDRKDGVLTAISELGYSPEMAQKLSKYLELNVEQVKSAARTVEILDDKEHSEDILLRLVSNSQKALGREKEEELRESVTKYSLDLLNISGNLPVAKIIESLKKRQSGTLCFYGLPGTGKTQLAEYIAMELDMPLMIKPASELLDKYLGETEKAIAKAFDDAKSEGAIFLLDEADSFLRDRSLAQRSWEISQVNELLQRMERFKGIFICATNLFEALDAAALRRFTFKLEFHALSMVQRIKMLENETGINFSALSEIDRDNILMGINTIKFLTPGDFATVKRQCNLLDEVLTPDQWIERLNVESKAKLAGLSRNSYSPGMVEVIPKK